jgi:hypothetical protein
MKFTENEVAALQNRFTLIVQQGPKSKENGRKVNNFENSCSNNFIVVLNFCDLVNKTHSVSLSMRV